MGNLYLVGQDSGIWYESNLLYMSALETTRADELLTERISDKLVELLHRLVRHFWLYTFILCF